MNSCSVQGMTSIENTIRKSPKVCDDVTGRSKSEIASFLNKLCFLSGSSVFKCYLVQNWKEFYKLCGASIPRPRKIAKSKMKGILNCPFLRWTTTRSEQELSKNLRRVVMNGKKSFWDLF